MKNPSMNTPFAWLAGVLAVIAKASRITRLARRAVQILTADSNRDAIVIWACCCAAAAVAVLQISGALQ